MLQETAANKVRIRVCVLAIRPRKGANLELNSALSLRSVLHLIYYLAFTAASSNFTERTLDMPSRPMVMP